MWRPCDWAAARKLTSVRLFWPRRPAASFRWRIRAACGSTSRTSDPAGHRASNLNEVRCFRSPRPRRADAARLLFRTAADHRGPYDRLGFYAYHVAEHHATPLGMAPSPGIWLAAIAQRTTQLRFGALVYLLP